MFMVIVRNKTEKTIANESTELQDINIMFDV